MYSKRLFETGSYSRALNSIVVKTWQRRPYLIKASTPLYFRNINENTLSDTPSGYIMDPDNHPRKMVTYERISSTSQVVLDAMEHERDLMSREELAFNGYTTLEIQEAKSIVFNIKSTQDDLTLACEKLQEALEALKGLIGCKTTDLLRHKLSANASSTLGEDSSERKEGTDDVVVSVNDCNHVRYVIALAMRKLNKFDVAESMCREILSFDATNSDAIESLIEVYTGTEQPDKIRELFDELVLWYGEQEKEIPKHDNNDAKNKPLRPVEVALVLLSDMIIEAALRHYTVHGEGSTSRFFIEAISPIASALGSEYTSQLIDTLYRAIDEQHFVARFKGGSKEESKVIVGFVVSFLKALLARNIFRVAKDPLNFEFDVLSKLHAALRYSGRKHESYKICERLIKLYRENSDTGGKLPPTQHGFLDNVQALYKTALFDYIEDRALDSLVVGKRLCIQAIEEFPEEAHPWEILALILHKENPVTGLDNAIVAANRAFSLNPMNLRVVLTLANFYKAQKRYRLYEMMMDRYRLLKYLIENDASEEDVNATIEEMKQLDGAIPRESEPDDVGTQFADIFEHNKRMEIAHTYSMPIDKEPRIFGEQPPSAPILTPSINADVPQRLVDKD